MSQHPTSSITYLTTKEMARLLGCHCETLRRGYRSGLYQLGVHCVLVNPNAPARQKRYRWNADQLLRIRMRRYRKRTAPTAIAARSQPHA